MNTEIIITADGSPTISLRGAGVTFHSKHGALAESNHVFIQNGLHYVMEKFETTNVLEVGFGTGLNAALTLAECRLNNYKVFYTAVEKNPLQKEIVAKYSSCFDSATAELLNTVHESTVNEEFFRLQKLETDFITINLEQVYQLVYFDAFAPASAPELWTEDIFRKIAENMVTGACLVTFCAQGEVRRRLRRAGFEVERLPGAPGKREMTRAIRL